MDSVHTNDANQYFSASLLNDIKRGNNAIVLSTLEGVDLCRLTDKSGATLLHHAAAYGNNWLIQHLIDLGANVDVPNNFKETPLMLAVKNSHVDTIKLLLEANADMFVPDLSGQCSFKKALDNRSLVPEEYFWEPENCTHQKYIMSAFYNQLTCELLNENRYVGSKSFHDDCPIYYFVPMKNADITRILLEKGSPVNAEEPMSKRTSLHIAVASTDLENVKVLLQFGANVHAKKYYNLTPLACLDNFKEQTRALDIFKLLMEAGANLIDKINNKILVTRILSYGNKEIIENLLKYPIDLHYWNESGETPLHYLALNRNVGVLEELRDFDFDTGIRDRNSKSTMLHSAAIVGNLSSIRFLLERNANINVVCSDDITPLCNIIYYELMGVILVDDRFDIYIDCINLLLAKGADPQIVTEKNYLHLMGAFTWRSRIADNVIKLMDPILTLLSAHEVSIQPISQCMRTFIQSFFQLENIYNVKKVECQEMNQVKVGQFVTLLDFYSATDKQISLYARKRRLYSYMDKIISNYNFNQSYKYRLEENFARFNKLFQLRVKAVTTFDEILREVYNSSAYNISQKIVEYLEDRDLNIFV